jgi:hypothetical protein
MRNFWTRSGTFRAFYLPHVPAATTAGRKYTEDWGVKRARDIQLRPKKYCGRQNNCCNCWDSQAGWMIGQQLYNRPFNQSLTLLMHPGIYNTTFI